MGLAASSPSSQSDIGQKLISVLLNAITLMKSHQLLTKPCKYIINLADLLNIVSNILRS